MNIKTLALTVTLTMSAITPAYADLRLFCEKTGDISRTIADARDAGLPITLAILAMQEGLKGHDEFFPVFTVMTTAIYSHPELSKEAAYHLYKSACIEKLIGTDM